MLTVSKDHPLLTTITGSLPRPHWFVENLRGRPFSVAMTDIAFREQYTDAVAAYLSDQTRAGLDLLTDGDARCDCDVGGRSWFSYATERLQGLEGYHVGRGRTASSRDKAAGDIMFEVLETRVLPNVTGPVRRGPLEYSRVWKVAQRQTRKPVKFGAISGQMVATGVHDVHFKNRRDLIMALSATMNEELVELADAGCPVIQVEEPAIHGMVGVDDKEVTGDFLVKTFNQEVRACGRGGESGAHTCWGNPPPSVTETKRRFYAQALRFRSGWTSTSSPSGPPTTVATRSPVSPKGIRRPTRRSPSASSATVPCRWSGPRRSQPSSARAGGDPPSG